MKEIIKAVDVSEMTNLSLSTIYLYVRRNIIPSFTIGTKIRFRRSEIVKLLNANVLTKND